MRTETLAALEAAALTSLQNNDSQTALELLQMVHQIPAVQIHPVAQAALPAVSSAPLHARDYHFWAKYIEDNYLPYLLSRNTDTFTTPQLLTWIESFCELSFCDEELEVNGDNRPKWKTLVGNALTKLNEEGVVTRQGYFSKTYKVGGTQPLITPFVA